MRATRRVFMLGAAAAGFAGLRALHAGGPQASSAGGRYGPLIDDPAGLLDLPKGFSYAIVSREGDRMSDGLFTPGSFDGMACFEINGSETKVALVRNHEVWPDQKSGGAFGERHVLAGGIDKAKIYDFAPGGAPKLGGTTTLIYDLNAMRLERSHLSLAGTCGNCAGGSTPWGSWLSCEETIEKPGRHVRRRHGYVFEVPSAATGLVDPIPLKAMGRFVHEAASVDPRTGIVYMTEDRADGLFYRFLPNVPGELVSGGKLQALALRTDRDRDLRNWPTDRSRFSGRGEHAVVGQNFAASWITMTGVESPDGDLKDRGHARGALRFARGEGVAVGVGKNGRIEFYISCTMGGPRRIGQIWRYQPSPKEGMPEERDDPARLELFVESRDPNVLHNCDNVTVAPWGDLLVCEDSPGGGPQHLRGVDPRGEIYTLARNAKTEFAGACFSPDGDTLFLNLQAPGLTVAINGPWSSQEEAVTTLRAK